MVTAAQEVAQSGGFIVLPAYVEDEFDAYLKCGLLESGVNCGFTIAQYMRMVCNGQDQTYSIGFLGGYIQDEWIGSQRQGLRIWRLWE